MAVQAGTPRKLCQRGDIYRRWPLLLLCHRPRWQAEKLLPYRFLTGKVKSAIARVQRKTNEQNTNAKPDHRPLHDFVRSIPLNEIVSKEPNDKLAERNKR